jgi:lipopolysaccharide assembly outer membrane protein LptD (OstA)
MHSADGQSTGGGGSDKEKDSLVYLLSSKSAQTIEIDGVSYRKVVGPARFLHNDTYLLCDTALWNVETKIIDAWGNVSILQDETVLTSDNLKYLIDEDLAQFRGSVVQLTDKDHNTLRTKHLDYNTSDSVAVF